MAKRLSYQLYQFFWSTLDWVFPPKCGGCGKPGIRWCAQCQSSTRTIKSPVCPLCGQNITRVGPCVHCQVAAPRYTGLRSWAYYDGSIRNAIHQLKYNRNVGLGEILSRPLLKLFLDLGWKIDIITPVPLGLARIAERGYNQSSLLAKPLSLALGIPYCPQILWRQRETRSQVGLSASERRLNVVGAFAAQASLAADKSIIVIDDVATSGSTLEACADALFSVGARKVYGLTLARAVFKSVQPSREVFLDG